jgi:apolipoprotein N-acyltransferase
VKLRLGRYRWWGLGAVSGAFLATAGPPLDFVPALWLGMVALVLVLEQPSIVPLTVRGKPRLGWFAGSMRGWFFGIATNAAALRFIPNVVTRFTDLSWPVALFALLLLAAEQGLRWAILGVLYRRLRDARVEAWFAFPAAMYVSTFLPVMIPWTPAGGAGLWLPTFQLAELVGERGVDVVMALVAALLASAWLAYRAQRARPGEGGTRRMTTLALSGLGVFLAAFVYGHFRIVAIDAARAQAPHEKVALIAPAFEATLQETQSIRLPMLRTLQSLTHDAETQGGAAVSVWPEGIYPWPVAHDGGRTPPGPRAPLGNIGSAGNSSTGIHGPVLSGVITVDALERQFNSATVFDAYGNMSAPYDKMHLLWFGETVPLAEEIPWIASTFARGLGLSAGKEDRALDLGGHPVAVMNCFEDCLPAAAREGGALSPSFLVNVTQDGWFSGTTESELHMRISSLRSVETRRDLVRAVNSGLTSWYDATGRLRATFPADKSGYLVADVALLALPPTFYVRFGDLPLGVALAVMTVVLVYKKKKGQKRSDEPALPSLT